MYNSCVNYQPYGISNIINIHKYTNIDKYLMKKLDIK